MRVPAFIWTVLSIAVCEAASGQALTLRKRVASPAETLGAALANDGRLITWGKGLRSWSLPGLKARTLAHGSFGEGGCLVDFDGDGKQEFVSVEARNPGLGKLTWRKPPDWKPVVIDDEFETHDCLEATLFGRKGLLVIQRYMQVRFYELADASPWPHREIYSIYTPSQQTGLSLHDVDGDGRTDIVCGNYWIQSPERFDLPWRIFAINTWFEEPLSAMLVHAFVSERLFVAQAHLLNARVALFTRPEDPKKLWTETRLNGKFHRVHSIATVGGSLFFGENNGPASRLLASRDEGFEVVVRGFPVLRLLPIDSGLIGVGAREVALWRTGRGSR